jgi:hypothetical protein
VGYVVVLLRSFDQTVPVAFGPGCQIRSRLRESSAGPSSGASAPAKSSLPSGENKGVKSPWLPRLPAVLPPEALRGVRGVQFLELIANPEARKVLAVLAGGAAGARLTQEAQASLERLAR